MSISERNRGEPCPHGDVIGSCPSSMCFIWTVEEVFEDDPAKVAIIRAIEAAATAYMEKDVIFDYPFEEQEADPHPLHSDKILTFQTRDNSEYDCGKLHDAMLDGHIVLPDGWEACGSYISHVIVRPIES